MKQSQSHKTADLRGSYILFQFFVYIDFLEFGGSH